MSGNILDVLSKPAAADPDFYNKGLQNLNALRDTQAKQAVGEAFQQSVDPATGRLDPLKLNQLLAANPRAVYGMQDSLIKSQALQGSQYDLSLAQNGAVNAAVTAALASSDDQLKATVAQQAQRLVAAGVVPHDRMMQSLLNLSNDPAQLRQQLETLRVQTLPPQQRQDWIYGTRPQVSTGGATVFPTVPAPGRGDAPVVLQTLTPEQRNATVSIQDLRTKLPDGSPNPDYGRTKTFTKQEQLEMNGFTVLPDGRVIPPSGGGGAGGGGTGGLGSGRYNVPGPLRNPNAPPAPNAPSAPNTSPAPNAPAAPGVIQFGDPNQPQAVPAPPGAPTSTAPYTGGGIGAQFAPGGAISPVAPNAGGPQYTVQPPPVIRAQPIPAGRVSGDVGAMMRGMQLARANPLQGGAMTAGPGAPTAPTTAATPEAGWGTAPGTYETAPPAPVARPATAPPPAAQRGPFDRPATGASPAELKLMESAGPQFASEITAGTQAQAQQAILGNMLVDTKQFLPGPWAETWKNIRARVAPVFGVNETALAGAENFDKAAAQLANSQGAGSDARMSVNVAANPHGGMSAPGVDLALRQLQGNADYLQARARLAQDWPAKADYNGFADSARQLDPRVFQYERMTGPQRSDYLDALSPKDARAFMAAHKWAEGKNLIPAR